MRRPPGCQSHRAARRQPRRTDFQPGLRHRRVARAVRRRNGPFLGALALSSASSFAFAQGETDWADVEGRIQYAYYTNDARALTSVLTALKPKAVQAPPGVLVGELVASGKFELCFQQIPELRQVKGIDYVGRLPRELQLSTVFSGAVHSKSSQLNAGGELLRHLASREAQRVFRKHGLDPA